MLSIKPLSSAKATAQYFFEKENHDVTDGVAQHSRWFGKGAEEFGLTSQAVDRETLHAWLDGNLPNGQTLGRIRDGERQHRPGIDLTFSAPKSVSILGLVFEFEEVVQCHDQAVIDTMRFIQDTYAQARMKTAQFSGEIGFYHTQHLTAALFQHSTSREQDPQLHTHVVLMNATKCADGQYRSLARGPITQPISAHSKGVLEQLYHNQRFLGAVYRGYLAHALYERGFGIQSTHKDARFEVIDVPNDLINAFSTRRHVIEAALEARGFSSARAASVVTMATNKPKADISRQAMMGRWRETCAEHQIFFGDKTALRKQFCPDVNTPLYKRPLPVLPGVDVAHIVGEPFQSDPKVVAYHREQFRQRFGFGRRTVTTSDKDRSTNHSQPPQTSPQDQTIDPGQTPKQTGVKPDSPREPALSPILHRRYPKKDQYYDELANLTLSYAVGDLHEREASFTLQDVMIRSLYFAEGRLNPFGNSQLHHQLQRWVQHEKLIGSVTFNQGEARLTTPQALALEEDTLYRVKQGQTEKQLTPLYTKTTLADAIQGIEHASLAPKPVSQSRNHSTTRPLQLTPDQHAVIEGLMTTSDRVVGICGAPGSGKTTAMGVAKQLADQAGYQMIGVAASASAALILADKTGMPTCTLAALMTHHQLDQRVHPTLAQPDQSVKHDQPTHLTIQGSQAGHENAQSSRSATRSTASSLPSTQVIPTLDDKTILVMDEASLTANFEMNRLIAATEIAGCRCWPMGDFKQFGAIAHGKPFELMIHHGMQTFYLRDIQRQRNPALKQAVYASLNGEIRTSMGFIAKDIRVLENESERLNAIADDYLSYAPAVRSKIRVATTTRRERSTLNALIRDRLALEGVFRGRQHTTCILESKDHTMVDRTQANQYQANDVIRFNVAVKELGIKPGQYAEVKSVHPHENQLTLLHRSRGWVRELDWSPLALGRQKGAIEVFETQSRAIAAGDVIRWTRNAARDNKFNGQCAKVLSVDFLGSKAKVALYQNDNETLSGKTTSIRLHEPRHQHWEHAYAWTTRSLQGHTCERILVNKPARYMTLTHERSFTTAISRAKDRAYLYTDDRDKLTDWLTRFTGEKSSAQEATYHAQRVTPSEKARLDETAKQTDRVKQAEFSRD